MVDGGSGRAGLSAFALSRRGVLAASSLLPVAAVLPGLLADAEADAAEAAYRFFTPHQAAVVDAATRRLIPGPDDDPTELGHPGAHEAGVVRYIDTLLAAFAVSPPAIFSGGPWGNRRVAGPNHLSTFTTPDATHSYGWRERVLGLQKTYADGVLALDGAAGGDFASSPGARQDQVLAMSSVSAFTTVMFGHAIEGMYCLPEYGGNAGTVGWTEISFPGDSSPVGYTAAQLAAQDVSVIEPTGVVGLLLGQLPAAATALRSGPDVSGAGHGDA